MAELSYNEMKTECARLGLNAKGSKQELAERLDRFERGDDAQKVYVAEEDNSTVSPDEVVAENPTVDQSQILVPDELEQKRVVHETEWDKIKARLDIIFAGRVQYFLQENCPNNYSIVFKGAARRSECINITAGEKTILQMAQKFVSPTKGIYITKGGDTPEEAMKKFQDANPRG